MTLRRLLASCLVFALLAGASQAQTAQSLFARQGTPSPHGTDPIGETGRGCLAGAVQLPESGPTWQAMRLGRNHHWGDPSMMAYIEDLSRAAARIGWKGLYVGDISQARGGPVKGHASHQTGLDVDIWYTPPSRLDLTRTQREQLSAINVRSADQRSVNANWTPAHAELLEAAARDPRANRIFVTGPVKLAMCETAGPRDAAWLRKIRPWWGHHDHFHVRLNCPAGARGCVAQDPVPPGDGCAEAVWWVTDALLPPDPNAPPVEPRAPLTLADLPSQCREVVSAR
jgi:penicillin-insensitive murein endopeptidase